jgi:hypothetical protein
MDRFFSTTKHRDTAAANTHELELQLARFDIDLKYGPSVGITRTARKQRAEDLGIKGAPNVLALVERGANNAAIWDQHRDTHKSNK